MAGTAIVAIHTREGFVIAADGRKRQGPKLITDSEQKLFSFKTEWAALAYSIAGISSLPRDESFQSIVFDFKEQVGKGLEGVRYLANFGDYVERLASRINQSLVRLTDSQHGISFPHDPGGKGVLATLVIVGHYDRIPVVAKIIFVQRDNKVVKKPKFESYRPTGTTWEIQIPPILGDLLQTGKDSRLTEYYTTPVRKLFERLEISLVEAREVATTLIRACTDPVASEIDPLCHTVGGHIHMATLTEAKGFEWVITPTAAQS